MRAYTREEARGLALEVKSWDREPTSTLAEMCLALLDRAENFRNTGFLNQTSMIVYLEAPIVVPDSVAERTRRMPSGSRCPPRPARWPNDEKCGPDCICRVDAPDVDLTAKADTSYGGSYFLEKSWIFRRQ